jgi:predicted transcriptional regulator
MRRDKLDILKDILQVSSEERVLITHIIYKSNTNSAVASRYINWLLVHEYLSKREKFYEITPKGQDLLFNLNNF